MFQLSQPSVGRDSRGQHLFYVPAHYLNSALQASLGAEDSTTKRRKYNVLNAYIFQLTTWNWDHRRLLQVHCPLFEQSCNKRTDMSGSPRQGRIQPVSLGGGQFQ